MAFNINRRQNAAVSNTKSNVRLISSRDGHRQSNGCMAAWPAVGTKLPNGLVHGTGQIGKCAKHEATNSHALRLVFARGRDPTRSDQSQVRPLLSVLVTGSSASSHLGSSQQMAVTYDTKRAKCYFYSSWVILWYLSLDYRSIADVRAFP